MHTCQETIIFTSETIYSLDTAFSRAFPDRRRWEWPALLSDEDPTPCPEVGRGGMRTVTEHTHMPAQREATAK